jgi:anti-sigma regulatory factor (Ser/Thr protein kinase)
LKQLRKYIKKEIKLSAPPPCAEGALHTLQIEARTRNLAMVDEFIYQQSLSAGFAENEAKSLELAIDEIVSNSILHAYDGNPQGKIDIRFVLLEQEIRIIVEDRGKIFDPSKMREPDMEATLLDRPIGGLGLFIAKQIMDEVYFEIIDNELKRFTLVKRFE